MDNRFIWKPSDVVVNKIDSIQEEDGVESDIDISPMFKFLNVMFNNKDDQEDDKWLL